MMLSLLVLTLSMSVAVFAEQIPCNSGRTSCEGSESLSIINNNHLCCDYGFNMQLKSETINGTVTPVCVCNRHFYATDCIEGQLQCQDATSLTSNGLTVKCCKNGASMNSVSSSVINGVSADYCKCIRYAGGNNFVNDLINDPIRKTIGDQLKGLQDLGSLYRTPGGIGQLTGNVLENIGRGLQESFSNFGDAVQQPGSQTTGSYPVGQPPINSNNPPTGRPFRFPMMNLQQRLFQLLPPRRQPGRNGGRNFLDRVSQSPAIMQMVDPRWWFNRDWRGMFGPRPTGAPVSGPATTTPTAVF
ncbi:uncharacterized protein LOC131944804 isoform X2 [Physella acuta]|uniref:uncharacterized protein LOC131944804 isoform X2 n=1 Tax=Physella acuta TaxID=109671 RepID=UPI0027DB3D12|nr:uncharacterized protein LOC131944804 isoform X2 [Physella acuta]